MSELFISILKKGEKEAENYDELCKKDKLKSEYDSDSDSDVKDERDFYCYTDSLIHYLANENNHYKYKMKKWVCDWFFEVYKKNFKAEWSWPEDTFWKAISENKSSGFFMNNRHHFKLLLFFANFNEYEKNEDYGDSMEVFTKIIENEYERNYVEWNYIAGNSHPKVVELTEKNMDKLNMAAHWHCLCGNKNAIHIIEKNIDKVNEFNTWRSLTDNTGALNILNKYIQQDVINNSYKIDHSYLCMNEDPEILRLVNLDYLDSKDWKNILCNPGARFIIKNNMDKLTKENRHYLFENPSVIDLIEKEIEKDELNEECIKALCSNVNACHLIEKYLDKLSESAIYKLNKNPSAMDILEKNPSLITSEIFENTAIFEKK